MVDEGAQQKISCWQPQHEPVPPSGASCFLAIMDNVAMLCSAMSPHTYGSRVRVSALALRVEFACSHPDVGGSGGGG